SGVVGVGRVCAEPTHQDLRLGPFRFVDDDQAASIRRSGVSLAGRGRRVGGQRSSDRGGGGLGGVRTDVAREGKDQVVEHEGLAVELLHVRELNGRKTGWRATDGPAVNVTGKQFSPKPAPGERAVVVERFYQLAVH